MNDSLATLEQRTEKPAMAADAPATKVAYVMSRFPTLTETFVLYEILAVQRQGTPLEIYPLLRGTTGTSASDGASIWKKATELLHKPGECAVMHAEAEPLVNRAHYQPFFSWRILCAQLYYLWWKPGAYLGALWALLRGTWGSLNYFVGGLAIFPKAVSLARRMQADGITHLHAHFANHPTTAAFIIHRLTGIPYSFTAHGSDLHRDQHMLREKVAEAEFVVPISQYNTELIARVCGPQSREKTVLIHCGVDTQVFDSAQRSALSGQHSAVNSKLSAESSKLTAQTNRPPFTILSIGKMHEVKGQTYLIEACRLLQKRGVDFRCDFVGDGPDHRALREQITQAGLDGRVRMLGLRDRANIVKLLREADVVAAPSVPSHSGRREGIPVVLMEAMASGAPVVASDLSGIPELVQDQWTGLLVPPRDAEALSQALQKLCDDPALCERLGAAGRDKVLDEFDLDTNAGRLAEHFRRGLRVQKPGFFKKPGFSKGGR